MQTLAAVQELPESAAYRRNVESITKHRLKIIAEEEDCDKIENMLGIGQIEEVIEQAKDELELIPHMAEWEPWKMPEGKEPVKINVID